MLHSEMIKDSCYNSINDLSDGLGSSVEERVCRQNRCTGEHEQLKIFDVDKIEWRFSWHENQFLFFFQNDIRGSEQHVFAEAVRNAAKRAHAAGDDYHGIRRIGTAREWCIHALEVVRFRAGRKFQSAM